MKQAKVSMNLWVAPEVYEDVKAAADRRHLSMTAWVSATLRRAAEAEAVAEKAEVAR